MPAPRVDSWLRAISISLFATLAEAKFPFSSTGPEANLSKDNTVTFDPLGVAAILQNPRADASAARLYVKHDKEIFHWPHTTMIGGTLAPMQMLVEHLLTAGITSTPPVINMCTKGITMIPIRSDLVFRELPLDFRNVWLHAFISFKSSQENAGNDFRVVVVDDAINDNTEVKMQRMRENPGPTRWMIARLALYMLGLINGALIMIAMLFGILAADVWAFVLFFLYGSHWVSTVFITFRSMVALKTPRNIPPNPQMRYAAYQRLEGGTVIFKCPQDELEKWARATWEYNPNLFNTLLHFYWMITGSLAAFASVACMVNMRGEMQLAFLAVLVYSSFVELVATKISRWLQTRAKGPVSSAIVRLNKTRSEGIIRATIEVPPECRLENFDWIGLELLPPLPVFVQMQATLRQINDLQHEVEKETACKTSLDEAAINKRIEEIFAEFSQKAPEPINLSNRLVLEMHGALVSWSARWGIHVNENIVERYRKPQL